MTRTNLVDAYDNRSVVAKLVNMEERISGAESSIEQTVKDGETSIDTKVSNGVTQINTLMTDLKDIKTEATAAASTAETATATANAAVTKAESASATIAANVTTCANAAADAKGYATSGVLHDGTAVNSAEYFQKLTQTAASQASDYADTAKVQATNAGNQAGAAAEARTAAQTFATNAKASETNAAASAEAAAASAASIDTSKFVATEGSVAQTVTGVKTFSDGTRVANRTTEATDTDVINFHDLMTPDGDYNNLVHTTGDEDIDGTKFFSVPPQCCMPFGNVTRGYVKVTNHTNYYTYTNYGFVSLQYKAKIGITEALINWLLKVTVDSATLGVTVTSLSVTSDWVNIAASTTVGGGSTCSITEYLYFSPFKATQSDTRYIITIPDMFIDIDTARCISMDYPYISEVSLTWIVGNASAKGNTVSTYTVPVALTPQKVTELTDRSYVKNSTSLAAKWSVPVQTE